VLPLASVPVQPLQLDEFFPVHAGIALCAIAETDVSAEASKIIPAKTGIWLNRFMRLPLLKSRPWN